MKTFIKVGLTTLSIALLTACGGGSDSPSYPFVPNTFLSIDNTQSGVVCVDNIGYDAYSAEGQQVARDLVNYYGVANPFATPLNLAYSAPTYCGGPTANYVPAPNVIIDVSFYYNVVIPAVR